MNSFSIQFYRRFYRVMVAVSVLCLACSACTRTGETAMFLPLMADNGQIAGLRFIFPPYQVASFAEGTREVDIPASVLYPYVGAEYRDLLVQP